MVTARRMPSLDGLRAISITIVLLAHAALIPGSGLPLFFHHQGTLGVNVFFVISGFLISTLLFKEQDRDGQIMLAQFYWRRTLRIFPAFYTFVIVAIGCMSLGWLPLVADDRPERSWTALAYVSNIAYPGTWYLGHTWSLSVEEQFYLLWPPLLVLIGKKKALMGAAILVVFTPLARAGIFTIHHFMPMDSVVAFQG